MSGELLTSGQKPSKSEWDTSWDDDSQEALDTSPEAAEPTRRQMGKRVLAKLLRRTEKVSHDDARSNMFSGDYSQPVTATYEMQTHGSAVAENDIHDTTKQVESYQRLDGSYGSEIQRVRGNELLSWDERTKQIELLESHRRGNAHRIDGLTADSGDKQSKLFKKEQLDDVVNTSNLNLSRDSAFIDRYGNKGSDALTEAKAMARKEIQAGLDAQDKNSWDADTRSADEILMGDPIRVVQYLPKRMRDNYLRIHGWIQ